MSSEISERLAQFQTEELITELLSRCSPAIFIGSKNEGAIGQVTFYEASGHLDACYGICLEIANKISRKKIVQEVVEAIESDI